MNKGFTQELLKLDNTAQVVRAMCERRDAILQAIEEGMVRPGSDVLRELVELNVAIGDAGLDQDQDQKVSHGKTTAPKNKIVVVARLTVIREVGVRTIVEVNEDATFGNFYSYFIQDGARRSTKKLIRCANRNEGLRPWYRAYRMEPGLTAIAEHFKTMPNITSIKIRIIRKRLYRKLLAAAPDAGLVRVHSQIDPRLAPRTITGQPVRIPDSYITISKRISILTGRG